MKQQRTETWSELGRAASDLRDRINRRIDADVESMRVHCPGVPAAALRIDLTRGSSDLLRIAEYFAAQVPN